MFRGRERDGGAVVRARFVRYGQRQLCIVYIRPSPPWTYLLLPLAPNQMWKSKYDFDCPAEP